MQKGKICIEIMPQLLVLCFSTGILMTLTLFSIV